MPDSSIRSARRSSNTRGTQRIVAIALATIVLVGCGGVAGSHHPAEYGLRRLGLPQHDVGRFARLARPEVLPRREARRMDTLDIHEGGHALHEAELQCIRGSEQRQARAATTEYLPELRGRVAWKTEPHIHFPHGPVVRSLPACEQILTPDERQWRRGLVKVALWSRSTSATDSSVRGQRREHRR